MSSMAESPAAPVAKKRIYVWELPVRLVHWVIFFSFIILSVTGYYIDNPFISVSGPAKEHFVMGTMRAVHLYTAIVFSLAVLVRIYWFFAGNRFARLTDFIPLRRQRWRGLWRTFLYYCFLKPHPEVYPGHDALAASTYAFIFLIYLLLIATGLALYTPIAAFSSPFQVFDFLVPLFGGLQMARLIHHICMYVVLIFAVVHIYSVVLWSMIEDSGEIDSMFNGHKFWSKRKEGGA
jgi:Ni/Fe-hydrogenase 1 B-type cytochrome subunit